MSESLTIDFSKPISLFPLDQCVLLPHTSVPLHIFEQRYRSMTADALDSDGLIAMATHTPQRGDGKQRALLPCVCVGYILQHQTLDDGRYNIMLHGICRAKIENEIEHEPYRKAILKPIEVADTMEIDLSDARAKIETLLEDEQISKLASIASIRRWVNDEIPTAVIVDLAAMALSRTVDMRYTMLAEPSSEHRAEVIVGVLTDIQRNLHDAARLGQPPTSDGLSLN